jgi:3-phosphoshikimate 1-carboxyvinyltransferase
MAWSSTSLDGRAVPCGGTVRGRLVVAPSKSATHRYLNLALLAGRPLRLERPLLADDTRLFRAALAGCGWRVATSGEAWLLQPGPPPAEAALDCGNAGTVLRFLTAALAALPGDWRLDGTPRLRQRPVGPLVEALRQLGAEVEFLGEPGYPPLRLRGGTLRGGRARLRAGESSQYLSALLMAGLRAAGVTEIEVESLTSAPYVELTLAAIERCGGRVERRAPGRFRVVPGLTGAETVRVEGDFSAACYPAAAAALTGGRVELLGLEADSAQGDRAFFELLVRMGAGVRPLGEAIEVTGGGRLSAIDADLSSMPDQVPTLAALAPFAAGTTRIRNVAHLRIKESDRLAAMAGELRRLGAEAAEEGDGLTIRGTWSAAPPPAAPVVVDPRGDHRIAMSLALVGLRRPATAVRDPEVVSKSYPDFWRDLEGLLQG